MQMTYGDKQIGDTPLTVDNITLAFGGVKALTDISFEIREHDILATIGPNGAGKTSMLNVINALYPSHKVRIQFPGVDRRAMRPHLAARQRLSRTTHNVPQLKRPTTTHS